MSVKGDESKVEEILDGTEVDLPLDVKECLEWVSELRRKNVPTTELMVGKKALENLLVV